MIKLESLTVGSDAEVPLFLADGTPFPVCGLVGGTKQAPRPLGKLGAGFAIQEDNVNLEFNIPPATTADMLQKYMHKALSAIRGQLPPTMHYELQAATEYNLQFLDNPAAQQFGCEPDYCVYHKEENPKPKCDNPALRTAAAHVHIGWEDPINADRAALVKMLDVTVGLSFLGIENPARKELYGKAGAYRPKKYGVEYRTPGNCWINDFAAHMFNQVKQAVVLVNDGFKLSDEQEKAVIESINTCKWNAITKGLTSSLGIYRLGR